MLRDILKYIYYNGLSYNGSTPDFGPGYGGSIPLRPTQTIARTGL